MQDGEHQRSDADRYREDDLRMTIPLGAWKKRTKALRQDGTDQTQAQGMHDQRRGDQRQAPHPIPEPGAGGASRQYCNPLRFVASVAAIAFSKRALPRKDVSLDVPQTLPCNTEALGERRTRDNTMSALSKRGSSPLDQHVEPAHVFDEDPVQRTGESYSVRSKKPLAQPAISKLCALRSINGTSPDTILVRIPPAAILGR